MADAKEEIIALEVSCKKAFADEGYGDAKAWANGETYKLFRDGFYAARRVLNATTPPADAARRTNRELHEEAAGMNLSDSFFTHAGIDPNGYHPADAALADVTGMIIRDACESDVASPDHPDTVCINVDDLTQIVSRHVAALRARAMPDGFVMVPRKLNDDMYTALVDGIFDDLSTVAIWENVMLAASKGGAT